MLKKIKTIKILLGTILCCSLIVCSSCGKAGNKEVRKVIKTFKRAYRIQKVYEVYLQCPTCGGEGEGYYYDEYGNQVSDLVTCPDCGGTGRR